MIVELKSTTISNYMTLEETLRPLWKLVNILLKSRSGLKNYYIMIFQVYYTGLMLDWCSPKSMGRISRILHSISIPFFLLLLIFNAIYQAIQLFLEIVKTNNHATNYIPNVTWFCTSPLTFFICVHFIRKREEMWAFFTDWRRMEDQFMLSCHLDCSKVRKMKFYIIFFTCVLYFINWIGIGWLVLYRPDESYLISYYKVIPQSISKPLVTAYHVITVVISLIYFTHSDMVPGFIFHHAGLVLRALEINIEKTFTEWNFQVKMLQGSSQFQRRMEETCIRYEIISELVKRANSIFGVLMIGNHGTVLFMICTFIYSTLYQIKLSGIDAMVYFSGFFMFSLPLIVGHLLAAYLYSSALQLRSTLSSLMSRHSVQLTKKDLAVASTFLVRLQEDQLAACPLGLYNVTASNLLTFTSLVISYVIVLLQAY